MDWEMLGFELAKMGLHTRAARSFANAIRSGRAFAGTYYHLGGAYESTGDHVRACAAYLEARRRLRESGTDFAERVHAAIERLKEYGVRAVAMDEDALLDAPDEAEVVQHRFSFATYRFVEISDSARAATAGCRGIGDFFHVAERAFQRGDVRGALEVLEAAVSSTEVFPTKRRILRFAAALSYESGDEASARMHAGLATLAPGESLGADACRAALDDAKALLDEGAPEDAAAALERAVDEMVATRDPLALQALSVRCRAYQRAERFEHALVDARWLTEIGEQVQDSLLQANGLALQGLVLAGCGKNADAVNAFRKAIEQLEGCDEPEELANVLIELASAQLALRDHDGALVSLARSEAIHAERCDESGLAGVGLGRARVEAALGRDARQHYRRAEALYTSAGDPMGASKAIGGLVELAMNAGNVQEAFGHMARVQSLLKQAGVDLGAVVPSTEALQQTGGKALVTLLSTVADERDDAGAGWTFLAKASVSLAGDHEGALAALDEAEKIFAAARQQRGLLRVAIERGEALLRAGRVDEALMALAHAELLAIQIEEDGARGDVERVRGQCLLANGKAAEAVSHLKQAVRLLERAQRRRDGALASRMLAVAHVAANDRAAATQAYERARAVLGEEGSPLELMELEQQLAIALLACDEAEGALVHARSAVEILRGVLHGLSPGALTSDMVEGSVATVATLIEAYRRCGRVREAVVAMEQLRAPSLTLASGPARQDDAAASPREAYARVVADGSTLVSWHIPSREAKLACVVARPGTEPLFLDLSLTQEDLLDELDALPSIWNGRMPVELLVRLFDAIFRANARVIDMDGRLISQASTLEEHAFSSPAGPLKIISQGLLQLIPFSALVRTVNGQGRYLVEDRPLVLSPQLRLLDRAEHRTGRRRSALLIASSDGELPHASAEAQRLAQRLRRSGHDVTLCGPESSLEIEVDDLIRYDLLHFATHGHFDPSRPFNAGLTLGPRSGDKPPRVYTLPQILRTQLRCDTAVLSACATGSADFRRVHEVLSLSSAFLAAGATRVLATLWNVRDVSTAALVDRMYEGVLDRGLGWAEALREAQIALLRGAIAVDGLSVADIRDPFHWAAMQCYGKA